MIPTIKISVYLSEKHAICQQLDMISNSNIQAQFVVWILTSQISVCDDSKLMGDTLYVAC